MLRQSLCVLALPALLLCAACDQGDEPGACFPIADGADVLRVARPGERDQGTSLQGEPLLEREQQGTDLQGGTRPDRELQGSSLQGTSYQGTDYQGTSAQGTSYQGAYLGLGDLNGARFELASTSTAIILDDGRLVAAGRRSTDAPLDVELVARTRDGREFPLQVAASETAGSSGRFVVRVGGVPVCAPGDEGMFVAGHWDDTGAHAIHDDELTYSCMSGVIAKCVDWGYTPWGVGADVHQACTRLARADYCGDGHPWTLDGTMIDVYDELGVQTPVGDPRFGFEAAWAEDGAVCANEMRYVVEDGDGRTVRPSCFADLPTCTSLQQAAAHGAVLANDSAHTAIDACE